MIPNFLGLTCAADDRLPAAGMMSTLMFGISILVGQFIAKEKLWKEVHGPLFSHIGPFQHCCICKCRVCLLHNYMPVKLLLTESCAIPLPQSFEPRISVKAAVQVLVS